MLCRKDSARVIGGCSGGMRTSAGGDDPVEGRRISLVGRELCLMGIGWRAKSLDIMTAFRTSKASLRVSLDDNRHFESSSGRAGSSKSESSSVVCGRLCIENGRRASCSPAPRSGQPYSPKKDSKSNAVCNSISGRMLSGWFGVEVLRSFAASLEDERRSSRGRVREA